MSTNSRPEATTVDSAQLTIMRVLSVLAARRFRASNERELQTAIARVLRESGLEIAEQVHLNSSDIPDLVIGRVGIELKVDGSFAAVARQLHRYAQSEKIDLLLLITTRSAHLKLDGLEMNGKCLRVFYLSMSAAF